VSVLARARGDRQAVADAEAALAARLGAGEPAELRRLLVALGEALDDGAIA
jgi:hypothetical protein